MIFFLSRRLGISSKLEAEGWPEALSVLALPLVPPPRGGSVCSGQARYCVQQNGTFHAATLTCICTAYEDKIDMLMASAARSWSYADQSIFLVNPQFVPVVTFLPSALASSSQCFPESLISAYERGPCQTDWPGGRFQYIWSYGCL